MMQTGASALAMFAMFQQCHDMGLRQIAHASSSHHSKLMGRTSLNGMFTQSVTHDRRTACGAGNQVGSTALRERKRGSGGRQGTSGTSEVTRWQEEERGRVPGKRSQRQSSPRSSTSIPSPSPLPTEQDPCLATALQC